MKRENKFLFMKRVAIFILLFYRFALTLLLLCFDYFVYTINKVEK